ncbi:hypothetical protein JFL43_04275 [Viridibacillus sp. YIM B01967]|uniref:Uncharacterized protein n=1 Tax=Viridibacillus soli TaxID=2798301 RepID=A0ABS1H3X1_9BACL|nr:hypothetical protein [Viridibacillus soli]MBK3494085.1 hypothetical protein [Viridibacillus soli]
MKKKKSMFPIVGALLVLSLSFATSASAGSVSKPHLDGGGGGPISKPPKCDNRGNCPI